MGVKSKGFTLIELMIVVAICAILAAILWPVFFGGDTPRQKVQDRNLLNGTTVMCIDGYKFVKAESGNQYGGPSLTQMRDTYNMPIQCQ